MIHKSVIVAEIGLLIYPECQLAAIYGLTDLFRIASDRTLRKNQTDQPPTIRVSHWQVMENQDEVSCIWDSHPDLPHTLSHVILPPSIVMPDKMHSPTIAVKWMKERHAEGSTLCSVCAGAFILAETGLMDGRRVTTHWAFAKQLSKRFPHITVAEDNMVIDDGDIVTAGGILAWTDLGLTLVQRFLGTGVMLSTARFLLIDPPRRHQNTFSSFIPHFDHGDEAILKTQHHLHAHAPEPQTIAMLADMAGMAERTFLRRFTKAAGIKPTEYLQQVRIMKARESLELTTQPIEQIAWQVGYQDPSAFRKTFQKFTGITPAAYRERFGVV